MQAEQDRTILTKRVQEIEALLHKKEELRLSAQIKLARATELADDAQRFILIISNLILCKLCIIIVNFYKYKLKLILYSNTQ